MVSIQCANKNPDGLKGASSLYGTAELTERYQLEHQEHQGVLRFDNLRTILGGVKLHLHRRSIRCG